MPCTDLCACEGCKNCEANLKNNPNAHLDVSDDEMKDTISAL